MSESIEAAPQDVYRALRDDGAVLIDVREPWEHQQMRIPGALLIPLGSMPERIAEIPEGRAVYAYCRMGGRSAKAAEFLRQHDRPRAFNVSGGLDAWKEAGLPVEE